MLIALQCLVRSLGLHHDFDLSLRGLNVLVHGKRPACHGEVIRVRGVIQGRNLRTHASDHVHCQHSFHGAGGTGNHGDRAPTEGHLVSAEDRPRVRQGFTCRDSASHCPVKCPHLPSFISVTSSHGLHTTAQQSSDISCNS